MLCDSCCLCSQDLNSRQAANSRPPAHSQAAQLAKSLQYFECNDRQLALRVLDVCNSVRSRTRASRVTGPRLLAAASTRTVPNVSTVRVHCSARARARARLASSTRTRTSHCELSNWRLGGELSFPLAPLFVYLPVRRTVFVELRALRVTVFLY